MNLQLMDIHPSAASKYYHHYPKGTTENELSIAKMPCSEMNNKMMDDMRDTLVNIPPASESYSDIIIGMNELKGMMRDLAYLSMDQKLQMICEAKSMKHKLDMMKSREYYYYPGRRYWRWRHYRNPYMWYMYRPWGWGYY